MPCRRKKSLVGLTLTILTITIGSLVGHAQKPDSAGPYTIQTRHIHYGVDGAEVARSTMTVAEADGVLYQSFFDEKLGAVWVSTLCDAKHGVMISASPYLGIWSEKPMSAGQCARYGTISPFLGVNDLATMDSEQHANDGRLLRKVTRVSFKPEFPRVNAGSMTFGLRKVESEAFYKRLDLEATSKLPRRKPQDESPCSSPALGQQKQAARQENEHLKILRQPDDAETARRYRKAAERGDVLAQANLGVMYEEGLGVAQDYTEAVRWYQRAAERGYSPVQYNLGLMYSNGKGVAQDDAEAARWYRKAAERGHPVAQAKIGVMHFEGKGVTQDYTEAHMWLNLASWRGSCDDRKKYSDVRDAVAKKMYPTQIAEAQRRAREWKPNSEVVISPHR
jgi:hypothetical protein